MPRNTYGPGATIQLWWVQMAETSTTKNAKGAAAPLPIRDFDHVELFVGNALQAAYVYQHAFGFTPVAYAGPETGMRDRAHTSCAKAR